MDTLVKRLEADDIRNKETINKLQERRDIAEAEKLRLEGLAKSRELMASLMTERVESLEQVASNIPMDITEAFSRMAYYI